MSNHYNPWPLGRLPQEMQRPEPEQIRQLGYTWDDPRDIVDIFEQKLADYANSKFAVVTDCCTNAMFVALKLREVSGEIVIPAQTYVSVPMQIHHAGARPVFEDIEWSGLYQLGQTGVWDSAARFTRNMYVGDGALQCLSFQIKKRVPIGRGGAILTNDREEYEKLKYMTYDGRNLKSRYDSPSHVMGIGWHYYMTPEDAARGILLMDMIPDTNEDMMSHKHYPDLRDWAIVNELALKDEG